MAEFYPSSKVFDVGILQTHTASFTLSEVQNQWYDALENGANPADTVRRLFISPLESKHIADELIHRGADVNMKTKFIVSQLLILRVYATL